MYIDDVRQSYALNYRQLDFSCKLEMMRERYEHVTSFQLTSLVFYAHSENVFFSNQSVLFQRDMVWVSETAAADNNNKLVTDLADAWDKRLLLKDR